MINITEKVIEAKKNNQRVYPCRSNRASQLGHPCERYLVYMRTSWEKQQMPEITREFIFDGGRLIEELAFKQLQEAGFKLTNQGRDFELKEQGITGHIDTYISPPDNPKEIYPTEIKGISPFAFDGTNSVQDMLNSDKHYMQAYPAQLQLYLLMSNKDEGLFYILNKLTYQPKDIWVKLDYDYAESLLKKAESINNHIKNNTLPERIKCAGICKNCSFNHICLPDIDFKSGIEFLNNAELEGALKQKEELEPTVKEYNKLDKQIKDHLKAIMKDKTDLSIGDWVITKKHIKSVQKPKPETVLEYDKFSIAKLKEDAE